MVNKLTAFCVAGFCLILFYQPSTWEVLKFTGQPYYTEQNRLESSPNYSVTHELCYDVPRGFDEAPF